MNKEQWDQLKPGSIIRNAKSGRLRTVLKIGNAGGIYLTKVSGRGTTCYCTGDKNLWEPTGFKINNMNEAYKLLKDMPGAKAGSIFERIGVTDPVFKYKNIVLLPIEIINHAEWFEKTQFPNEIEEKIAALISSIKVDRANFEHISETRIINGSLYQELSRVLREAIKFELERKLKS